MTNEEFIREYGLKEMIDLFDGLYTRLIILRLKRKIGKFKINKKRRTVCLYGNKTKKEYEIAMIYFMSDSKIIDLIDSQ